MKRFLSVLLILGVLCSLALPVSALTEPGYIPIFEPTEESFLRDKKALTSTMNGAPHKRGPLEDNLMVPGPLTEKCAYYIDLDRATFSFIAVGTGKSNQYFCVQLYVGKEPKGEPIFSYYEPVGALTDTTSIRVSWDFDSQNDRIPEGQYTLVSFTAEPRDNYLNAIDGTASMTDVYFYRRYIRPQKAFLMDWETGVPLDTTLRLTQGETLVCAMGRSPLPSHGQGFSNATAGNLLSFEDIAGLCVITAEHCGTATMTVTYDEYSVIQYNVEVCTVPGGHKYMDKIPAALPTTEYEGVNLYVCEQCGLVRRETTPNLTDTFEQFKDISSDAWYADYVKEAVCQKLFNGINANTFGPNQPMTRAMLVTVLWRYEGEPGSNGTAFDDVPANAWYAQGVNWAAQRGIVNGVGKGRFNPNGTVTREQLTTILYRYAQQKVLEMSSTGEIDTFPDGAQVSSWARDAMAWALGAGLVSGVGKNQQVYLMPQGNATRAQVSTILIRFIASLPDPYGPILYPDASTALDSGLINGDGASLIWAFYEDGTLQLGGTGNTPAVKEQEEVPWSAYKDRITDVEILYGIGAVSQGTFANHSSLRSVVIPMGVSEIGDRAFTNCTSLEFVELPETVTEIGNSAFEGCTALEYISFPEQLRSIGAACFKSCSALTGVILPQSLLDQLGEKAFEDCTSLELVILPIGMETMRREMFSGCSSLAMVEMPLALKTMELGVFGYCSSLESMSLPPYLETMCYGTFTECTSLKNLYIFSDILDIVARSNYGNYFSPKYYNDRPFGVEYLTVVWGCSAYIRNLATMFGYTYKDISELN